MPEQPPDLLLPGPPGLVDGQYADRPQLGRSTAGTVVTSLPTASSGVTATTLVLP
jgi:hypothetical protein